MDVERAFSFIIYSPYNILTIILTERERATIPRERNTHILVERNRKRERREKKKKNIYLIFIGYNRVVS